MIFASGNSLRSSWIVSMPSFSGMKMSVTITSAVRGAFGFDAATLKPPQRKLPEVVAVVDDENARHVPGERKAECGFYAKRRGQSTAVALLRQHQRGYRGRYPGTLTLSRA